MTQHTLGTSELHYYCCYHLLLANKQQHVILSLLIVLLLSSVFYANVMSTSSVHIDPRTAYANAATRADTTAITAIAATATANLQQSKARCQSGVCSVILAVTMVSYSRSVS
jgi:peptidoglycan/LPS O-acetylase OafA/YrhL